MRPHVSTSVWAFVDLLFNVLLVTLFINAMLSLPQPKAASAAASGVAPGLMCATLFWPDSTMVDVDLWGRDPKGEVVFYRHRSGRSMDLLRDDLGNDPDPASHHFETMCSRELTAGEWTFNAVYYGSHMPDGSTPDVPVSIEVAWPGAEPTRETLKASDVLRPGGEETLMDFRLDADGKLVPSSVNHLLSSLMR